MLYSTFLIDHFDLFGLRQVYLCWRGVPYTEVPFKMRSLYRYVRHPMMVGFIIAFWATPKMSAGHLLFAIAATGMILIGIQLEERDLMAAHGASYGEFRSRVAVHGRPAGTTQAAGRGAGAIERRHGTTRRHLPAVRNRTCRRD